MTRTHNLTPWMRQHRIPLLLFVLITLTITLPPGCTSRSSPAWQPHVDSTAIAYGPYRILKLPVTKGVNILNPIQLQRSPSGDIFAANQSGEVYILRDQDQDGIEETAEEYCNISDQQLRSPSGLAFRGDTVYIGTREAIQVYLDRDHDNRADTSWTFFRDIPTSEHPYEWTTALNFGPDNWLYCTLSTDSWNQGASPDPNLYRGAILRISPDGKQIEKVATGIRSVYGSAFAPNGSFFFTDNEGGGNPVEELNHLRPGDFYGHNPLKYQPKDSAHAADHILQTEAAPSGIVFNSSDNDFGGTAGQLFIAFYGPGERWTRGGVGRIEISDSAGTLRYHEYPVADIPKLSGIAFGKDGSLYLAHHGIADYWYNSTEKSSGGFYKLVYDPALASQPPRIRKPLNTAAPAASVEAGRQLFLERACAACHATEPGRELLGPDLNGVGKRLSRNDILKEIKEPSAIIKPSMGATRVFKKDGTILLGRMVNADDSQISLMLVGNHVVSIPRSEITRTEDEKKSLMYENLLRNLNEEQVNQLLDYLVSLP